MTKILDLDANLDYNIRTNLKEKTVYLKLQEKHVKDLNPKMHKHIKETLNEKNMEYQDVKIILSVELKDKEKPSKTLMEYTRKGKETKKTAMSTLQNLFASLKDGYDKDLSDEKNQEIALAKIEEEQAKLAEETESLSSQMQKLFKDMLIDEDNKLVLFVENQFINIAKDVDISSYKDLPDSIKELVEQDKLNY